MYSKELKELQKLRSSEAHSGDRRSKAYKDAEAKMKSIAEGIYKDYAKRMFDEFVVFNSMKPYEWDKDGSQWLFFKGKESFCFQISDLTSYNGTFKEPSGWFVDHFGQFNQASLENPTKESVKTFVEFTIQERQKDRKETSAMLDLLKELAEDLKDMIDPHYYECATKREGRSVRYSLDNFGHRGPKDLYIRLEVAPNTDLTVRVSGDIRATLKKDDAVKFYRELKGLADKYCF